MYKVTVIIPVYNVESYIAQCLDSVVCQTLQDIEILCVDDKSRDSSMEIVNAYAERDKRIRIIEYGENRGLSFARNRGIEAAKGEYVVFWDSDDMLEAAALGALYKKAVAENLDGLFFDAHCIYETKEVEAKCAPYCGEMQHQYLDVYTGPEFFAKLQQHNDLDIVACRYFWKRQYLYDRKLLFYEGILHEDNLFSFQAILLAQRMGTLNRAFYIYRRREESITTKSFNDKRFYGCFIAYAECIRFLQDQCLNENIAMFIYQYIKGLKKFLVQQARMLRLQNVVLENHVL